MKFFKYKTFLALIIIMNLILPIYIIMPFYMNKNHQINESFDISSQAVDRSGKIFDNITRFSKNCFINREQPSLNEQPRVNIPNYNISYAEMSFENITALNYTRSIEDDFSEFVISSRNGPTYIYQKFAIEISQFVNNVSILIQDINNPTLFTDENSWEVAIVNCLNDTIGTPNPTETLGLLKKPHPISYAAHWEVFDFKNSGTGPIFLNISNTKMTYDGRYWFAFRIKIPQDDSHFDGGPKFLYFNPDDDNIGEGDIYAISPDFSYDAYTINDVNVSEVTSGTNIKGELDSFKYIDEDRYLATDSNNVTIDLKVHLDNLKNSPFNYTELLILHKFLNWPFEHYKYIFSFDFYLIVNVSDISRIENATLSIYNYKEPGPNKWVPLPYDIIQENETMIYISIRNPWEKIEILRYMDNFPSINNTLRFQLEYIGKGLDFNVSINHFKVEVGEIENLQTIQRHDPLVQEFAFPSNIGIVNGSTASFGDQTIDSLEANDDDYYQAQALTDNLSFFMTFNVLNDMDSSLWDVDYYDWLVSYPNPVIPLMDIRISSNVSKPENLEYAILALYKGNATFDILEPDENKAEWIFLSRPREFAHMNETTTILHYDAGFTWIFLNLLNESRNNEINLVLFYYTNSSSDFGFNVSINEFSLNFYIQNAIPSDISSSIGLGINSNALTPSDIRLQNFGVDIGDTGIGSGFWEGDIDNAVFSQGIFEFNITSLWHSIRFDVNGTYEIFKIEPILEFVETPASQYMTGTTFISALITEYGGKPLENFEIIFEVLNSNGVTIYEASSISNEEGIATVTIQFESTGERYLIQVEFAESGFYASAEVVSEYIRVVNEFILFMDEFLNVLPYIIIGALAIASYVTVRKVKHGKQRKFWAKDATVLDDLVKIAHILIIHKDAGVSIYNKQISLEGIDSDLISGFLQAISHFRSEIKKDTSVAEGKGFEMDYGDFKIVITDGNYARIALILDGTPSEKLKENQWLFTEDFERRFSELLKDFDGDITPFRETDDLIEKRFNISLIYPLQLGKHYGVIKLKGLEKALVEVGEQIQKERKFFFISSLLNFALAGRKASRDEIISAILGLKRKGLIIPFQQK